MATPFHVLKRQEDGSWVEITTAGTVDAANDRQAIRKATDGQGPAGRAGEFLCVAGRSWRPVVRDVETQEVDRWS